MKVQIFDTCKGFYRLWFELDVPKPELSYHPGTHGQEISSAINQKFGNVIEEIKSVLQNPIVCYTLPSKSNEMQFTDKEIKEVEHGHR